MPRKYYAVKRGRIPGLYSTWEEAKKQIQGFSSAVYKGFPTKKEAEEFLRDTCPQSEADGTIFYTDGSYKAKKGGFAILRMTPAMDDYCYGKVPEKYGVTNNTAELYAIKFLLQYVRDDPLTIRTDSIMAVNILAHQYEAKRNIELITQIKSLMEGRTIIFEHVFGHKDDEYNNRVDELANQGRISF